MEGELTWGAVLFVTSLVIYTALVRPMRQRAKERTLQALERCTARLARMCRRDTEGDTR